MNLGGWIILLVMWGGITGIGVYCFTKILSDKSESTEDGS